jgi:hypothetical protein
MRKPMLLVLVLATLVLPAFSQGADFPTSLLSRDIQYMLRLADGKTKIVTVKYDAGLFDSVKVTGDGMSFFHPVDTRRFDVTVYGAVSRTIASSQGSYLFIDPKFDKTFEIGSKTQVFQNFSFFKQSDRKAQIEAFSKSQSELMTVFLKGSFDKVVTDDQAAVRKALELQYSPIEVIQLDSPKK